MNKYNETRVSNSNDRERKVKEFILLNQGCHKKEVVDDAYNQGYGSKVPILDTINELIRKKIVFVKRDKPNSKIHRLFIEKNNSVIILSQQLDNLNSLLLVVVNKIFKTYIKPVKDWPKISTNYDVDSQLYEVINLLFYLINFISDAYEYHYKVKWPKYDEQIRDDLYSKFFTQLGEWYNLINNKVSQLINKYEQDIDDSIVPPKRRRFIRSNITFHKENRFKLYQPLYKIQLLENNFKSHGVGEEYKKLIDYLFEINLANIEIVYPELHGYESIDIIKDDKYLEKYRKRFNIEYEE